MTGRRPAPLGWKPPGWRHHMLLNVAGGLAVALTLLILYWAGITP